MFKALVSFLSVPKLSLFLFLSCLILLCRLFGYHWVNWFSILSANMQCVDEAYFEYDLVDSSNPVCLNQTLRRRVKTLNIC